MGAVGGSVPLGKGCRPIEGSEKAPPAGADNLPVILALEEIRSAWDDSLAGVEAAWAATNIERRSFSDLRPAPSRQTPSTNAIDKPSAPVKPNVRFRRILSAFGAGWNRW